MAEFPYSAIFINYKPRRHVTSFFDGRMIILNDHQSRKNKQSTN